MNSKLKNPNKEHIKQERQGGPPNWQVFFQFFFHAIYFWVIHSPFLFFLVTGFLIAELLLIFLNKFN